MLPMLTCLGQLLLTRTLVLGLGNECEYLPTTGVEGEIWPPPNLSARKGITVPPGIAPRSTPNPTLNDRMASEMSGMPNVNGLELEDTG